MPRDPYTGVDTPASGGLNIEVRSRQSTGQAGNLAGASTQRGIPGSPFHFPDYHATWGEPERYGVRVSLSQKAYTQVMEHAASDRREVGGLLLGILYRAADNSAHVRVAQALPHYKGIGQMATFSFTHEGWAALADEVERDYPQLRIVGWYHSHPSYGAFFSATDKETQRNYFSNPWRVGLVVDHIRHEGAFFVLAPGSNKVEALPGFYEYVGQNGSSIINWEHYRMRPAPPNPTSPPPPDIARPKPAQLPPASLPAPPNARQWANSTYMDEGPQAGGQRNQVAVPPRARPAPPPNWWRRYRDLTDVILSVVTILLLLMLVVNSCNIASNLAAIRNQVVPTPTAATMSTITSTPVIAPKQP